jgi:hypothetical protein
MPMGEGQHKRFMMTGQHTAGTIRRTMVHER